MVLNPIPLTEICVMIILLLFKSKVKTLIVGIIKKVLLQT